MLQIMAMVKMVQTVHNLVVVMETVNLVVADQAQLAMAVAVAGVLVETEEQV